MRSSVARGHEAGMRTAEHTRRDAGRSHFRFTASRESGSIRVLLAEDNRALAREFLDDLARAGGEVDVVRRGDHALDALVRAPVDVAVMDEGLRGLDGRQLCERLRALRVWTPVLLNSCTRCGCATN